MAFGESAAYHELFADDALTLRADDFQLADASGGAAGEGDEGFYAAEVLAETRGNEAGDFVLRELFGTR